MYRAGRWHKRYIWPELNNSGFLFVLFKKKLKGILIVQYSQGAKVSRLPPALRLLRPVSRALRNKPTKTEKEGELQAHHSAARLVKQECSITQEHLNSSLTFFKPFSPFFHNRKILLWKDFKKSGQLLREQRPKGRYYDFKTKQSMS